MPSDELPGHSISNPIPNLTRLQERAFGGEDVAARPDHADDSWWPRGPFLPGVQEMIEHVVSIAGSQSGLSLYFLLGGAGNGKSFAARELAVRLGVDPKVDPDGLARRSYESVRGNTRIILMNDATIAPTKKYGATQAFALASDLASWIEAAKAGPVVVLCCVNRGIVVDELRALPASEPGHPSLPEAILQWLANPSIECFKKSGAVVEPSVPSWGAGSALSAVTIKSGGVEVEVHALGVDSSSLVEEGGSGTTRPAEVLFREVLVRCNVDLEQRPPLCPIGANLRQLFTARGATAWTDLMRAAEIASGRLFSYRDIWGVTALSIVGPKISIESESGFPAARVIEQAIQEYAAASSDRDRLSALIKMAEFRFHNAIFRSPIPKGGDATPEYPASTPFQASFSPLDPSLWSASHQVQVENAMQVVCVGGMPTDYLFSRGCEGEYAFSAYDFALERALVGFVSSEDCADAVRRRLVSWFSGYLMRLIGVATGNFGNEAALSLWRTCYNACSAGPAPLPLEFQSAISGLLFPKEAGESSHSLLIPAFAARAEPLIFGSRTSQSELLAESIDHSPLALRMRRSTGRLLLECVQAGQSTVVGELAIDFALVRDALTWRNGRSGQTESTNFIEPRLERCRAASLASLPDNQRRLIAFVDGKRTELQ